MTNKEAAKMLLTETKYDGHSIFVRSDVSDAYLDAVCLAISALMEKEEMLRRKPYSVTLDDQDGWQDYDSEKPTEDGAYFFKCKYNNAKYLILERKQGAWYNQFGECCAIPPNYLWIKAFDTCDV